MKSLMVSGLAAFIVGCSGHSTISHHESERDFRADSSLRCVDALSLTSKHSAADITVGARRCLAQKNYDRAAELMMVASAYAYYDKFRVADRSAHGALNALFAKELYTFPQFERGELYVSIDKLDAGEGRKRKICRHLESNLPPSYYPKYMIAHGMDGFSRDSQNPLITAFDKDASWRKALAFIRCD